MIEKLWINCVGITRKSNGYGNQYDYSLLRQFVNTFDVPVNIQDDKGDTVMHHIIRNKDYDAIYVLLNSLKPRQVYNFRTANHKGHTAIHEIIKCNNGEMNGQLEHDYSELKRFLNTIQLKSYDIPINAQNAAGDTIVHLIIRNKYYEQLKKFVESKLAENYNFNIQNAKGNSAFHEMISPKDANVVYGNLVILCLSLGQSIIKGDGNRDEYKYTKEQQK